MTASSPDFLEINLSNQGRDLLADAMKGNTLGGMYATMLLGRIRHYYDAAAMQMERMQKNLDVIRSQGQGWEIAQPQRYTDAHFYFICWHAIHRDIELFREIIPLASPRDTLRRYREQLEHYSTARDHLEHHKDRVKGKKNKKGEPLAQPGHLGYITGETLHYGGDDFDISTGSLNLLQEIVGALFNEVMAESDERASRVNSVVQASLAGLGFRDPNGVDAETLTLTELMYRIGSVHNAEGQELSSSPAAKAIDQALKDLEFN